jgi:hypothetical protein
VPLAEAEALRDAQLAETLALPETLPEVEALGGPLPVPQPLAVVLTVPLCVDDKLGEEDAVLKKDGVARCEGDFVKLVDFVPEGKGEPVRDTEGDRELLIVPLRLTVGLRVTDGHTLRDAVGLTREEALAEGLVDWLALPD